MHKRQSVGDRLRKTADSPMQNEKTKPLFVNVDTVRNDLGVSRAKAYQVIKELNTELKKKYPMAIVVAGKVNRIWYEEACLQNMAN